MLKNEKKNLFEKIVDDHNGETQQATTLTYFW